MIDKEQLVDFLMSKLYRDKMGEDWLLGKEFAEQIADYTIKFLKETNNMEV